MKSALMKAAILAALLLAQVAATAADGEAALKINVTNLPDNKGTLNYLVFSKDDGFPDKTSAALRSGHLEIPADMKLQFVIDHLPPGEYAISLYQDQNKNNKLDKGFMGIPKEPVGASNNPKSRMGPPLFKDAKFQVTAAVDGQPQEITINMVHR